MRCLTKRELDPKIAQIVDCQVSVYSNFYWAGFVQILERQIKIFELFGVVVVGLITIFEILSV